MGKADAGQARAAELLGQAVVASPAADSALRTDPLRDKFKDGAGVIVQSAYNGGIDLIPDVQRVKGFGQALVVCRAVGTKVVKRSGRICGNLVADGRFTVEDAQRLVLSRPRQVSHSSSTWAEKYSTSAAR